MSRRLTSALVAVVGSFTMSSCVLSSEDPPRYPPSVSNWEVVGDLPADQKKIAEFVAESLNIGNDANSNGDLLSEWENRIAPNFSGSRPGIDETGGLTGRIIRVSPGPNVDTFEVGACEFDTPGLYRIQEGGELKPQPVRILPVKYYVMRTTKWSRGGQKTTEPRLLLYATSSGIDLLQECRSLEPPPRTRITPTPTNDN